MNFKLTYLLVPILLALGFYFINRKSNPVCNDKACKSGLACKLTSADLRKRKETVIAGLQKELVEKKELKNGYAFRFPGSDDMMAQLNAFVNTERECCDFFTFHVSRADDKSAAWLELTGPEGTKEFIKEELGM